MSWDWFDGVYCIHLPDPERRQKIEAQFQQAGIKNVRYVHATPPTDLRMSNMRRNPAAEFGCSLSHIKAVLHAITDGCKRALFFEDDVEFISPERIDRVIAELPKEWQVLYFGGHPRESCEMYSDNLASVRTFSFAEAYALTDPAGWLSFWLDRVGQKNAMYDLCLGDYAAENTAFCVFPLMTRQPVGWSIIGDKIDDKSRCLNKGWQVNLSTR